MRKIIEVQYPTLDHTESIANIKIEEQNISAEGITIQHAFWNKHNSLFIVIKNNGNKTELLTVRAGNAYPNSMLGDIVIELCPGISAIRLEDLSRFEKEDSSLDLDFSENFEGTIYAIAKGV